MTHNIHLSVWRLLQAMLVAGSLVLVGCSDGGQKNKAGGDVTLIIDSADQFDRQVLRAEKPVLVDFWATWCPPCHKMNPIVEESAALYHSVMDVAKVDIDENKILTERFSIRAVPTFIMFNNGKLVSVYDGRLRASSFKKWIDDQLNELGVEHTRTAM